MTFLANFFGIRARLCGQAEMMAYAKFFVQIWIPDLSLLWARKK